MRKNEQMRSPRSNRSIQSNGGSANSLLGLPGGAFDGFKADPFFGGSPFESAKMLDSKNLPLSSLLMGAADARNAVADPAAYFHGNGVPPNLMSLNSLLSMAALPNYFANPELLNLFMRQFEPKAFKELPEQIFGNCNGLVNGDEMLKNKALFDNHEQTLRKLFQQLVASSPPAPVVPLPKNAQRNEHLSSPSLPNEQINSNNNTNSNTNNLSTSFLNLSKMSDSDSSSTVGKKEHPEQGALVNGNGSKCQLPSKKSTETPNAVKKEEITAANEVKCTTATAETNGKQFSGSNQHNHNMKMDSDEESQRDSSSLDDEMLMSDGKKVRVRSVLSEETLRVLRAQYTVNPRPKKQEILRLSEQVSYSPRVVQVWFQNMRYVHCIFFANFCCIFFASRVN